MHRIYIDGWRKSVRDQYMQIQKILKQIKIQNKNINTKSI